MEARVAELEAQVKGLIAKIGVDMPPKKKTSGRKEKTEAEAEEPKKKKSPSGYLLYANDTRASVKQTLIDSGTENPKPTDVIKEVAKLWRDLSEEDKTVWNEKAKQLAT